MRHQDAVNSARLSPDGKQMLTVTKDNSVRLWDARTGKPLGGEMRHQDAVNSAQLSPDGTKMLTVEKANSMRLWEAETGKLLGEVMTHQCCIGLPEFSSDGTRVVADAVDKTTWLWDISSVSSDNGQLLPALAEAVAGNQLNELGAIERLEDQVERLNHLRQQTANAPLGEPTAESFIRWFLSDPWTRTVSPLSSLTVPDYIQQQIAAGRREQMEQEFPGHPLLRPSSTSTPPKPSEQSAKQGR